MIRAPARMFVRRGNVVRGENLPEVGLLGDGAVARGAADDDVLIFAVQLSDVADEIGGVAAEAGGYVAQGASVDADPHGGRPAQ